jgi:hypothetical protein
MQTEAGITPAEPTGDSELVNLAQTLAAEDGETLPAAWLGAEGANAPVATQPTSSDAKPVVRIGDAELPLDEAQALIEKGKAVDTLVTEAVNRTLAEHKDAIELQQLYTSIPAEVREEVASLIEMRANGQLAAKAGYADIPGNAEIPQLSWDQLSDESRMIYSLLMETISRVGILGKVVKDLSDSHTEVADRDENAMIVQALKAKGIEATPEFIAKMKHSGITDPVKAVELFAPMMRTSFAEGAKKADAAPKSPEVPIGQGKVYDDSDPNLTADDEIRLIQQGYQPASGNVPTGLTV